MNMITGINEIFEHEGRKLHIQCEDFGSDKAVFEVRVYDGGTVLWLKSMPYADLVGKGLGRSEHEQELRLQMTKILSTVKAAIVKGKIS
jgi:hypothetical protein